MNTYTGEVVHLTLGQEPPAGPGWVLLEGDADDVERLARSVRRTAAEDRRRKARRKAQRSARRRSRP